MKNITLSIPEDLLKDVRKYAAEQGTSLNELVRELLRQTVYQSSVNWDTQLNEQRKNVVADTRITYKRDDLHQR